MSSLKSILATYRAQHLHGLPPFDLVICDEAHRATGASFEGDSESNFVKIHDNAFIKAAKRLYMTAILSNVRCLSEGVDVPALDAVLFFTPRNSQVDDPVVSRGEDGAYVLVWQWVYKSEIRRKTREFVD